MYDHTINTVNDIKEFVTHLIQQEDTMNLRKKIVWLTLMLCCVAFSTDVIAKPRLKSDKKPISYYETKAGKALLANQARTESREQKVAGKQYERDQYEKVKGGNRIITVEPIKEATKVVQYEESVIIAKDKAISGTSVTVNMVKEKECKSYVRFKAADPESKKLMATVYLNNSALEVLGNPDVLTITIASK